MNPHLLIILPAAGYGYIDGLGEHGFTLSYAASIGEAVRRVMTEPPDAVLTVVDDASAPQLCEVLRALGSLPLLVACQGLPAAAATDCLDRGADAIVMLPMPVRELGTRIRAVLRRTAEQARSVTSERITIGDLAIDLGTRTVSRRGVQVDLSPTEFRLLVVLAENPGRVVTNRELLTRVWSEEYVDDVHYVRLYIGYLRNKLEDDPHEPELILNQWGVGYRLAAEDPVAVH